MSSPIKIVTSFQTLMHYAHELGKARLSGDPERIQIATENHDAYRDLCLRSDEMTLGCTRGEVEL